MEGTAGIVAPPGGRTAHTVSTAPSQALEDAEGPPSITDLHLWGAEEIRDCLREICVTTSERVDAVIPTVPSDRALQGSLTSGLSMVERGVHFRSLFPDDARRVAHVAQYAEHVGRYGVQVRHGAVGQVRIAIFDDSVALISTAANGPSATPSAVVTRTPGVVAVISSYFALLWTRSRTMSTGAMTGPGATREASILAAVVAGKTDRAIAREHGIDERTVQRTLTTLRQRYGVNSRYELVAEAVARGDTRAT